MVARNLSGPVPRLAAVEREREEFIGAAPGKRTYPWQEVGVRTDVRWPITTRVPEASWLQVKWLAHQRGCSAQAILNEALDLHLRAELSALGVPVE